MRCTGLSFLLVSLAPYPHFSLFGLLLSVHHIFFFHLLRSISIHWHNTLIVSLFHEPSTSRSYPRTRDNRIPHSLSILSTPFHPEIKPSTPPTILGLFCPLMPDCLPILGFPLSSRSPPSRLPILFNIFVASSSYSFDQQYPFTCTPTKSLPGTNIIMLLPRTYLRT